MCCNLLNLYKEETERFFSWASANKKGQTFVDKGIIPCFSSQNKYIESLSESKALGLLNLIQFSIKGLSP